ncbi:MAG: baseplate J/gp47 family protein [Caulobacteraceae bacterium]
MAFTRPTRSELIAQISGDMLSRFPGADSLARRAFVDVLGKVVAGAVDGLYGFAAYIARQVIPDTAEDDNLDRWASIWGVTRSPAQIASGSLALTGDNGSVVPAGTVLQRRSVEFVTLADATIAGGAASVAAEALVPGASGNLPAGTSVTFVSPVSGVASKALVAAPGIAGGVDQEADEDLRARLLTRISEPPQGGAEADYLNWALSYSGEVTRAWVYPSWTGAGTVGVTFVCDNRVSIFPLAGDVAAMQAYIDALRPVTATAVVFAPTAVPLNLTIAATPNTAPVKDAITAAMTDLLVREAYPGCTIRLSHIREAVSGAFGETDSVVTVPAADVVYAAGQMPTLGVITWA